MAQHQLALPRRCLELTPPPVAAVACGTNSTRLLVVDGTGAELERQTRVTRLGEAVDATGRLSAAAVERTLEALEDYGHRIRASGAQRVRVTATSAARDAHNRDAFFAAAEQAMGVTPELLNGEEEARLSFRGATGRFEPDDRQYLVVDLGGGSTELAVGRAGQAEAVVSVDVGCVRLTERFLHTDPPRRDEIDRAQAAVRDHLAVATQNLPGAAGPVELVLVAGPFARLPVLEARVLSRGAVEDVLDALTRQTRAERMGGAGLDAAVADVVVGGAVILLEIMRHFDLARCTVSDADLLDGLVLDLLATATHTPPDGSEMRSDAPLLDASAIVAPLRP